jgi:hypothetical protein
MSNNGEEMPAVPTKNVYGIVEKSAYSMLLLKLAIVK